MFAIKGFLETSFLDWRGKIASVIFLGGCNFRCPYCHNYPLVINPTRLPSISLEAIFSFLETHRDWIDGVVITGGEPTLSSGLISLIEKLRGLGVGIKLDTNGTNPTLLKDLLDNHLLDYVAMDIKAPLDQDKYRQVAGVEVDLDLIRESISVLRESTITYEFRTTLLPLFFSPQDIMDIAQEIRGAKQYVLQNFNPQNPLDPRLKEVVPFLPSELEELAQKVKGYLGEIRVIY